MTMQKLDNQFNLPTLAFLKFVYIILEGGHDELHEESQTSSLLITKQFLYVAMFIMHFLYIYIKPLVWNESNLIIQNLRAGINLRVV